MLESLVTWLVDLVDSWGYAGIFAMMFLESTFFPFPSEVAMIPAGYLAFQGRMDPFLAVLMGFLGSLLGAYFNYYFARAVGLPFLERYGRYFFVKPEKLEKAVTVFRRHGDITTFVCRLIPVVRQLISVPAGIARMSLFRFGFYTGLGAGIWVAILTGFGWFVGKTFQAMEEQPGGGLASTWERIRSVWNEHELKIYLGVGIPLALVVGVYMLYQRRKKRDDAVADEQSVVAGDREQK